MKSFWSLVICASDTVELRLLYKRFILFGEKTFIAWKLFDFLSGIAVILLKFKVKNRLNFYDFCNFKPIKRNGIYKCLLKKKTLEKLIKSSAKDFVELSSESKLNNKQLGKFSLTQFRNIES